jgi:eukaryotic-like serine/threonine-protein kinase
MTPSNGHLVFISNKLEEYIQRYGTDHINRYIDFYSSTSNQNLREIFALLHYKLNGLFKYLNGRITNGHYTAHESRELLYLIDEVKTLKSNLKGTDFDFEVLSEYEAKLIECEGFLKNSGGSAIPSEFVKVGIVEAKPIFLSKSHISIKRANGQDSFAIQLVGKGSYATVFKYKDDFYDRMFALKRANKDLTDKEYQRFKIEFETMKKLKSPYVIEVYTFDEAKRQYIMEYADETLDSYISMRNQKIDMIERINLVRQVFRAFSYINSQDVFHRDISTTNILLKKYDALVVVKVSDFGLVKQKSKKLTSQSSEIKGVLNDQKLEMLGFNNYEIRHETFALTRLVYFIITGKLRIEQHRCAGFNEFIQKGISDHLGDRYASVDMMRAEFNKIADLLKGR